MSVTYEKAAFPRNYVFAALHEQYRGHEEGRAFKARSGVDTQFFYLWCRL